MNAVTCSSDANVYRDSTGQYPAITHGRGVFFYDGQGREYMDFGSGIAVASIGPSAEAQRRKEK